MRLKLVPSDTKIPFLRYKFVALTVSILMMVASLGLFFTRGVNQGIDFTGGVLLEVGSDSPLDISRIRAIVAGLNLGDAAIQEFGEASDAVIRIERQPADPDNDISDAQAQQIAAQSVLEALQAEFPDMEQRRVEFVGPKVSGELVGDAALAVSFAIIAVLLYIWIRFEWQFGLGAVIALIHDVVLTLGFFSVTQLEFNLPSIAAILTIVGYSLNDTVVVYDRVREKLRKYRTMDLEELLNFAINKTLSRTVMTSVSTLLALLALFFFGGAVINSFIAAMIWGVVVGTYSSVFVASPILLYLNLERGSFELADVKS